MRRTVTLSIALLLLLVACGGSRSHSGGVPSAAGNLLLTAGALNPSASGIPSDAQDVTALQFRLDADPTEDLVIESITVHSSGTGDDGVDIAGVELWLDADGDGLPGGGDTPLAGPAIYPGDDGDLTFTLGTMTLLAGTGAELLVVYDFQSPGTAPLSNTFEASVFDTDIQATGALSGGSIVAGGDPVVLGGPFTIILVELRVSLGAGDGAIPSSATIGPGDRARPIMQFSLAASGVDVDVTDITFTAAGSGWDDSDLTQIRVHRDTNGDGVVDPVQDPQVGSAPKYSFDDGEAMVSVVLTVPAGSAYDYVVVYNFKSPLPSGQGNDFQAKILGGGKVGTAVPLGVYGSAVGKYVTIYN